jgi:hypothetical protein
VPRPRLQSRSCCSTPSLLPRAACRCCGRRTARAPPRRARRRRRGSRRSSGATALPQAAAPARSRRPRR